MSSTARKTGLVLALLAASTPLAAQVGAPATKTGVSLTPYIGVLVLQSGK